VILTPHYDNVIDEYLHYMFKSIVLGKHPNTMFNHLIFLKKK